MRTRFEGASKVVVVALVAGLITGCAGMNERIDAAMAEATSASSKADAARSAADSAAAAANEAKGMASSAQRDAQSAQRAADQANSCCSANSDKMEAMFKESMRK